MLTHFKFFKRLHVWQAELIAGYDRSPAAFLFEFYLKRLHHRLVKITVDRVRFADVGVIDIFFSDLKPGPGESILYPGDQVRPERIFYSDQLGMRKFCPNSAQEPGPAATQLVDGCLIVYMQLLYNLIDYFFSGGNERRESAEDDIIELHREKNQEA